MINVYNTLTRKKEEFKPIEEGKVKMYVCGPTVYDVPHIGHARSAYVFDIIRRYFEYTGLEVCFVRNVTDIDDKIIKKAADELKDVGGRIYPNRLKERVSEVSERYLNVYHHELDILGIKAPDIEPRATENIEQMLAFIEILIAKEYAYVVNGSVYFDIEKFRGYGKLSNQNKDQMMHGVRIDVEKDKHHPLDFVLWKKVKQEEPSWNSPWGEGRPGWHIECSVMSTNLLGPSFDVHGGGLDLIFPHHENEIAQAEAATNNTFANYWIHNGLLFVDGEKMSKSLGNYVTIEDFRGKYTDTDLLKITFLNSHYRSAMDYSDKKMEESRRAKERIMIFFDKSDRIKEQGGSGTVPPGIMKDVHDTVDGLKERFAEAMNDDFNTPSAMAVIFEAVKLGNDCFSDDSFSVEGKIYKINALKNCILLFSHVFGLSLVPEKVDNEFEAEINKLIDLREKARREKDFDASDRIRDELIVKGVVIEDTPEGPVWRKS